MRWVRVADLRRGMRIELRGRHMLWDRSGSPWRRFAARSRHLVLAVKRVATRRGGRQPYVLDLQEEQTRAQLNLEVADGDESILVVGEETGHGPDGSTRPGPGA